MYLKGAWKTMFMLYVTVSEKTDHLAPMQFVYSTGLNQVTK